MLPDGRAAQDQGRQQVFKLTMLVKPVLSNVEGFVTPDSSPPLTPHRVTLVNFAEARARTPFPDMPVAPRSRVAIPSQARRRERRDQRSATAPQALADEAGDRRLVRRHGVRMV